jgi:NDP-sugar pyrophosphorylase family protein
VCASLLALLKGDFDGSLESKLVEGCDLCFFMDHNICCSFPLAEMVEDHISDPNRVLTALGMPRKNENLLKYAYFVEQNRQIKHYFAQNQSQNGANATIDCGVYLFSPIKQSFKMPF